MKKLLHAMIKIVKHVIQKNMGHVKSVRKDINMKRVLAMNYQFLIIINVQIIII